MKFTPLPLPGLVLVEPAVHGDARGFFMETYREDRFAAAGIPTHFVQDNHSRSRRGTVRGLHYQRDPGQAKLVRCASGAIWDVAVDIRPDSPTFGRWHGEELTADNHRMLYIPIGFAHGFAVLSDVADVLYKVSSVYNAATEAGIAWDDPGIGVDWRVAEPILSERDRGNPRLRG
jgi:dTDP-4-dehydrorhamnose 3,5-epimerase